MQHLDAKYNEMSILLFGVEIWNTNFVVCFVIAILFVYKEFRNGWESFCCEFNHVDVECWIFCLWKTTYHHFTSLQLSLNVFVVYSVCTRAFEHHWSRYSTGFCFPWIWQAHSRTSPSFHQQVQLKPWASQRHQEVKFIFRIAGVWNLRRKCWDNSILPSRLF